MRRLPFLPFVFEPRSIEAHRSQASDYRDGKLRDLPSAFADLDDDETTSPGSLPDDARS